MLMFLLQYNLYIYWHKVLPAQYFRGSLQEQKARALCRGPARNSDTSLFRRLNGPKYFPLDRHATMPTVQCSEKRNPLVRRSVCPTSQKGGALGRRFNMPNRPTTYKEFYTSLALSLSLALSHSLSKIQHRPTYHVHDEYWRAK